MYDKRLYIYMYICIYMQRDTLENMYMHLCIYMHTYILNVHTHINTFA